MSLVTHEITPSDTQGMQTIRSYLAAAPKLAFEPGAREAYDRIIGQAPVPAAVAFEHGVVGGVPGWWARPERAKEGAAILYLHGGGYVIGSASAYRNFVGQIARKARAATFIADYALAPERPFPAADDDTRALHAGLLSLGYERIAFCGDSAGGGLVLSYLARHHGRSDRIVAVAAMSPWIDLTVSGESMASRADQDPILSKETLGNAATLYLEGRSPGDPRVDVLGADLSGLPPVRVHVGDAEVLLDDSVRFARKAERDGLDAEVHVWQGMIHVFPSNFAMLQASAAALDDIGAFLARHLDSERAGTMNVPVERVQ
ncbi:alpha/beta hydrolase [Anaeromyxobacter sp. Red801]|uniref:alpha/beta hydrolase n=1 Tax=Anaeromyxobacter sp. Red801 TaxID=3411632 RepID=UPI003BA1498C